MSLTVPMLRQLRQLNDLSHNVLAVKLCGCLASYTANALRVSKKAGLMRQRPEHGTDKGSHAFHSLSDKRGILGRGHEACHYCKVADPSIRPLAEAFGPGGRCGTGMPQAKWVTNCDVSQIVMVTGTDDCTG